LFYSVNGKPEYDSVYELAYGGHCIRITEWDAKTPGRSFEEVLMRAALNFASAYSAVHDPAKINAFAHELQQLETMGMKFGPLDVYYDQLKSITLR
jgi:hypothetical protein